MLPASLGFLWDAEPALQSLPLSHRCLLCGLCCGRSEPEGFLSLLLLGIIGIIPAFRAGGIPSLVEVGDVEDDSGRAWGAKGGIKGNL